MKLWCYKLISVGELSTGKPENRRCERVLFEDELPVFREHVAQAGRHSVLQCLQLAVDFHVLLVRLRGFFVVHLDEMVGDFLGEGCLTGQPLRMAAAVAAMESSVTRLEKSATIAVLRDEPAFSALFVSYLLTRNIRIKKISSISFSIRAKSAWRGFCCCWPTSAKRGSRRR